VRESKEKKNIEGSELLLRAEKNTLRIKSDRGRRRRLRSRAAMTCSTGINIKYANKPLSMRLKANMLSFVAYSFHLAVSFPHRGQ
jgi:hypothetical protein